MVKKIISDIIIELSDHNTAKLYLNSLLPEKNEISHHRSQTQLFLKNNKLKISISATDITAFRASVNSYINWIKIIDSIIDVAE
ncbi:MAG: KEOPS complex subunit Pcc1 [Candidatus Helarchaeota archaeon]